jgi:hypothetical protein
MNIFPTFRISRGFVAIASLALMVAVALSTAGVAQAAAPVNVSPPSLAPSGTVTDGAAITLTQGTWDMSGYSISDSWSECPPATACSPITPTGNTYTPSAAEDGDTIQVIEKATNDGDTPASMTVADSNIVTVVPPAPTNSSVPTVSGNPDQGGTLTALPGTWQNNPTYGYAWYDCTGAGPTCALSTTSANSATYTVTSADTGAQIEVQVTGTNPGGSAIAISALEPASVGLPVNTTPPSIGGTLQSGSTLTEHDGVWTNSPTLARQWLRCSGGVCTNITSATGTTYTLASADLGDTIEVVVTASNAAVTAGGTVAPAATSAMTGTVVLPPPVNRNPPTISGDAQAGQTLTEKTGSWTGSSLTYTEQWSRCDSDGNNCVPILSETGPGLQYTVTDADVGGTLEVSETATNSGGSVTVPSGLTNAVTDTAGVVPIPALTSAAPDVSGTAQLGSALTATRVTFSGNPGTYAYQWRRCNPIGCLDIPGATSLTYLPTAADVGYALQIVESATNSEGTSAPAQSPTTAVITAPSTTILQSSVRSPAAGQSVSLIAAVSSPAGSLEAGTITFSANGQAIAGCAGLALPPDPTQPVICRAAFAASSHALVASFAPTSGTYVTGSASPALTLAVRRVTTTTSLGSPSRILLGNRVTYRATVRPRSSGSLKPAGTVTFRDGKASIAGCARLRLHAAAATCTVRYLGLRTHTISVRYRGDADFAASRSAGRRMTVAAQSPTGVVTAYMSWTFAYGPAGTQVRTLSVSGLVTGTRISMACSGGGCAFHRYAKRISAPTHCRAHHRCQAATSLNLTPAFQRRRLRVGAHLTVILSHHDWLGKYYRFTVRHSRKPSLQESCLAVGGTRPSVGCTAGA